MMKLITFILCCITSAQSQSFFRYELTLDRLELPKIDDLFDYGTLRIKKFNRTTFAVNGYCDLLMPFSDDIEGRFTVFAYQGNEYRKLGQQTYQKMCTLYKNDKVFVPLGLNQTSYGTKIRKCPIEPQRVHFYDLNVPADFIPFQPPTGEKYRMDIAYSLADKLLTNFSIYFSLKRKWNEWTG